MLTKEEIEQRAQMEAQRASKLMHRLVTECLEETERSDQTNFKIDTIGVVGICSWVDDEGVDKEDGITAFETKRHHLKTGILLDVLAGHMYRSG